MFLPVCYTFRRCPYAIRARMALQAAQIQVEYREIIFKNKPPQMLKLSPKGTVPVLVLENGEVIDESWDVMHWALDKNDPQHWQPEDKNQLEEIGDLIQVNDFEFKDKLDRYKYADRHPEKTEIQHRSDAEFFLKELEARLNKSKFLMSDQISMADIAIFPFIRQFAIVDINWFNNSDYTKLRDWLNYFIESNEFKNVMDKKPLWLF